MKKKTVRVLASAFCLMLVPAAAAFGQAFSGDSLESSEDEFFSSSDVEAEEGAAEVENMEEAVDRESVSLSGELSATGSYGLTREFVEGLTGIDDNSMNYYLTGDFLLDVRLRKGFRAFLDLNIGYSNIGMSVIHQYNLMNPVFAYGDLVDPDNKTIPPGSLFLLSEDQDMLIGIKELFVDLNIANTVYFRIGKQVLQWGRGYLWNPTDLVNIERRSFMDMDALRDGVFGMRLDFIFCRNFQIYTFFQFQGAESVTDIAMAGKLEFLIGSVEMGLSAWYQDQKLPVFGFDISAPLFLDIDFRGELALSWGDNRDKMDAAGNVYSVRDQLVPKFSVGLSRGFTIDSVDNKLVLNGEFYYNHTGYDVNMFEVLDATHRAAFLAGYYESGNYGRFYGALFVTINEFFIDEMAFTLSGIGNFSDLSFTAMADLSYAPVSNFTISFRLMACLGQNLREYTISLDPEDPLAAPGNNFMAASASCNVKF